jgi:DNA replication protein DnaC
MTSNSNDKTYTHILDHNITGKKISPNPFLEFISTIEVIEDEDIECLNCSTIVNKPFAVDEKYCTKNCKAMHQRKDVDIQLLLKIPKRYREVSFGSFKTESNIVNELRDIINSESWEEPILFNGEITGTGKTHLAICTIVEMARKTAHELVFINFADLMGEIFASIKNSASESVDSVIKKYSNLFILCIDDLGAEHTTDYSTSVLYRILNNRYNSMKTTIVTTNLNAKEICDFYDKRILSRLGCGHVFTLSGKDKREGTYKKVEV